MPASVPSNAEIAKLLVHLEATLGTQMAALTAKVDALSLKVTSTRGSSGERADPRALSPETGGSPRDEPPVSQTHSETFVRREKRRETLINKCAKEEIYGIAEEEQKEIASRDCLPNLRRGLIHPHGLFRQSWDGLFMLAGAYVVLVLPYRIAFVSRYNAGYAVIDFLLDVFFMSDVLLNFFTAFCRDDGLLVTSHVQIARHYARTWFLPDALSSIPFDWFSFGSPLRATSMDGVEAEEADVTELRQLLRVLKCIKLLRLLTLSRAGRYLQRMLERWSLEVMLNSNMLRLFKVVMFTIIFAHWNGCIQYLLATLEAQTIVVNGTQTLVFHEDSWVARLEAQDILDETNAWSWSFFGAWMQMLSLGSGIQEPRRQVEVC
jgi:hypothetical protein